MKCSTLLSLKGIVLESRYAGASEISTGLWYEIEPDSTTARTMNDTNRGFVLYHLLPTGGYYEPRLNEQK